MSKSYDGLSNKDRFKAALIMGWFFLILFTIAAVWTYLEIKSFGKNSAGMNAFIFFILGILWTGTAFFLITLLAALFGKAKTEGNIDSLMLFGFEIQRTTGSVPLNFHLNDNPLPPEISWSWIAYEEIKSAPGKDNIGILEAALWYLAASKHLSLTARKEAYTYFGKLTTASKTKLYYSVNEKVQTPVLGVWEKKFLATARDQKGRSNDVSTLLTTHLNSDSRAPVMEIVKKEYEVSGVNTSASRTALAKDIHAYKANYPQLDQIIKEVVEQAYRSSQDVS